MVKENKNKLKKKIIDVFFIGKNINIFKSLNTLCLKTKKFNIEKIIFNKKLLEKNKFILIDDSSENFNEIIMYFKEKKFKEFFILSGKNNFKYFEGQEYKIFFKPIRIFELENEVYKKVSKKINGINEWKLDRSKLKFFKNENNIINLTEKEFYFILFLLKNKSKAISKLDILNEVCKLKTSSSYIEESRVVEKIAFRIRKKFSKIKNGPVIIKDKIGYRILV